MLYLIDKSNLFGNFCLKLSLVESLTGVTNNAFDNLIYLL